jgi:hypothetical protein
MSKILLAGASALTLLMAGAASAEDRSAPWQAQIGDTAAVQTQSNGGAGITIAIVDTGIVATHPEVYGRVSTLSSCAAVTFTCSNGYTDDHSHGTAVASIAGGRYNASLPISMSGVAPNAIILSEKVLSASGSGYSSDVANGIIRAADGGAKVINLSLTYMSSSNIVSAVNYATSKNAVIVWAGGNSATDINGGANTTGLTAASLKRMMFVGSVGSTNLISNFSNMPGAGVASAGSTSASYKSLWIMAPGSGIIAPFATLGSTSYSAWTGTSMSAPEVSGAVALLAATWPILITKRTASSVLFLTATDLGAAGVDGTYGNGLLNISKAFQPIGAMYVISATGSPILISSLTTSMVSGGALGSFDSVSSQLSSYTAFDSFDRNFVVDLSSMIASNTGAGSGGETTTTQPAPVVSPTKTRGRKLADGGYVVTIATRAPTFGETVWGDAGVNAIADRMFGQRDRSVTYVSLVDGSGNMLAVGRGVSSTASFAQAMWGADAAAADQANKLGVSTALMGLAQGGYSTALGYNFSDRARLAVGWSSTDLVAGTGQATDRTRSSAEAAMVGVTARLTSRWSAGVALSSLGEANGLLGTTYDGVGALSLGEEHRSRAVSVNSSLALGGGRDLLVDAAFVDTDGATMGNSLFRDVSPLKARAYGVSLVQRDAFRDGDRLTLTVRKPLRVTSGQATLALTDVDEDGYPVTRFTTVDLAPSGDETNVSLAYATTFGSSLSLNATVDVRTDARNTDGLTDVGAKLDMNYRF